MKKFIVLLSLFALFSQLYPTAYTQNPVFAQTPTTAPVLGPNPAGVTQLQQLIQRAINLSVGLAFIILTLMLVWAGIRYLTSGGEAKALSSASGTITWALLGMLFLILAWLILRLIYAFTGVNVTHFCIGFAPFCP